MVITKDSESFDPGSSPGRTFCIPAGQSLLCLYLAAAFLPSLWPNWIRRLTTNQKIGGSSPSRDIFLFLFFAFIAPSASSASDYRRYSSVGRASD